MNLTSSNFHFMAPGHHRGAGFVVALRPAPARGIFYKVYKVRSRQSSLAYFMAIIQHDCAQLKSDTPYAVHKGTTARSAPTARSASTHLAPPPRDRAAPPLASAGPPAFRRFGPYSAPSAPGGDPLAGEQLRRGTSRISRSSERLAAQLQRAVRLDSQLQLQP